MLQECDEILSFSAHSAQWAAWQAQMLAEALCFAAAEAGKCASGRAWLCKLLGKAHLGIKMGRGAHVFAADLATKWQMVGASGAV